MCSHSCSRPGPLPSRQCVRPTRARPFAPAAKPAIAPRARRTAGTPVQANFGDFLQRQKIKFTISSAGEYDQAAVAAAIGKLTVDNPVVVFAWTKCPYCIKAKSLLKEVGATFTSVDLDTMPDGPAFRAELCKLTGRTSVPNIWIGQKNVGGCSEGPGVVALHERGELVPLLKAAGAL